MFIASADCFLNIAKLIKKYNPKYVSFGGKLTRNIDVIDAFKITEEKCQRVNMDSFKTNGNYILPKKFEGIYILVYKFQEKVHLHIFLPTVFDMS